MFAVVVALIGIALLPLGSSIKLMLADTLIQRLWKLEWHPSSYAIKPNGWHMFLFRTAVLFAFAVTHTGKQRAPKGSERNVPVGCKVWSGLARQYLKGVSLYAARNGRTGENAAQNRMMKWLIAPNVVEIGNSESGCNKMQQNIQNFHRQWQIEHETQLLSRGKLLYPTFVSPKEKK